MRTFRRSGSRALVGLGLLLTVRAEAASLDQLEVGGLQGTPATDGAASVWWNPAMMSAARGTRVLVEVAPVIGSQTLDRASDLDGGPDRWDIVTALPFAAVVTDAGVKGLGLGLSFQVPYALGGTSPNEAGSGRTHLQSALIESLQLSGGLSLAVTDWLGIGLAGTWVHASYRSVTYQALLPDLADAIGDTLGQPPQDLYGNDQVEDPGYLARIDMGPLWGDAGAVQVGLWAKPAPKWTLSASLYSGATVDHRGRAHLDVDCPPESDGLGRFGAQREGLCDAKIDTNAVNTYTYPMRVSGGLRFDPAPGTQIELMGGWVRWSQYHDFVFTLSDAVKTNVGPDAPDLSPRAKGLLEQTRPWARGNRDSFWIGVDGKVKVHDLVTVDARVVFDRRAVEPGLMSPNTADFDRIKLGAGLEVRAGRAPLFVGVSYVENVAIPRTETDSRFRIDIDPAQRVEPRLFWPQMNGTYTSAVHRVGISLRAAFGGPKAAAVTAPAASPPT